MTRLTLKERQKAISEGVKLAWKRRRREGYLIKAQRLDDARKSYDEAIRACREKQIRAHAIKPRSHNAEELHWAREGVKEGRG